ncbi:ATP-dependent helicase/nuclease subunit A [Kineococcus radiotolerans]|uniref:DNA 3'-5' helicase n=1 Tax=Kineococcus radiotolerans TaxID=131568 RepID=A0A7W4XZF3_KINRA|nr:UvrD-helicase domain-containing protein [Kineococcus radiotolerans]MBB2903512.1 ATP-dependent helicase/nuclease subunit A [Kineococcus radiotolerans]
MNSAPQDQSARDRVRTSHAETLFVEAGAGTGKTTALVARVVHMVATGHLQHVGELAAITFTENAASELRSRIREGLEDAARGEHRGTTYEPQERDCCRTAAAALDDAAIGTLHGTAIRILQEAPLEAGLPPGFAVASATGGDELDDDAWEDFLADLLADPAVADHVTAAFTLGLSTSALRGTAATLAGAWDRLRSRPLRERPLPPVEAGDVLAPLRAVLAAADRWPEGDKLTTHLREVVHPFAQAVSAATDRWDVLALLGDVKLSSSGGRKPAWQQAGLDKAEVVDALAHAQRAVEDLRSAVGAATTETLTARVQDWLLAEADRRRELGALSFHDLLVLARDLLRRNRDVRERLHAQWPVLLIDEFQDTDPLQVEIACLLAGDCGEEPPEQWQEIPVAPGRLFFVGDAKQSIYRFRGADVATFTAVGDLHERGRTGLAVNFRSVPGVLEAANHAFRTLIGADPAAGIAYADLHPARDGGADGVDVPVLLLGGDRDVPAGALRDLEAEHVADVIARAKAEGWPVEASTRHPDGTSTRGQRPAQYRDVTVLLPTRTPLASIERALEGRDIPYRVESRSLVWSTDAVRAVLALLQAVDSPADQVALLAALRQPGLACSDVDLVGWRAAGGRWSIHAAVPEGIDEQHPVAAALRTLRRWHEQRWWVPVNQLVEEVVRELRLVELTASQRRPRDHWRRLRFVVDQAREWCDRGGSGLTGFLSWTVRQQQDSADLVETVVPEPDDDAVRILTVHGSKGLEFPVTVVAGLNGSGRDDATVLWAPDGPLVRFRADVLEMPGWRQASQDEKAESEQEAIRLLYVALTRAQDHLVVGCYHKPSRTGGSRAQKLWELLADSGLARCESEPRAQRAAQGTAPATPFQVLVPEDEGRTARDLPDRAEFLEQRAALLAALHAAVATSATAVRQATAVPTSGPSREEEPAKEHDAPDTTAGDEAGVRPPRRTTRRRGAAVGTAVHRVLELADLRSPSREEVRRLAEAVCAAEQVPDSTGEVEQRAWSALTAPVVRDAADGGRTWREVYLVVDDGQRYLEGYVDLLAETSTGELVVVDYKTDRVRSAADVAAKEQHYAGQLDAYADALARVLGRRPDDTRLVFAQPGEQRVHGHAGTTT